MFDKMRNALLNGCFVTTTHAVHFCYSYSLCFEDLRVTEELYQIRNLLELV